MDSYDFFGPTVWTSGLGPNQWLLLRTVSLENRRTKPVEIKFVESAEGCFCCLGSRDERAL
jgi:hypothetical protein